MAPVVSTFVGRQWIYWIFTNPTCHSRAGVYISISFPINIGEEFWNFINFSEKFQLLTSVTRGFFLKNMNIEPKSTKTCEQMVKNMQNLTFQPKLLKNLPLLHRMSIYGQNANQIAKIHDIWMYFGHHWLIMQCFSAYNPLCKSKNELPNP